MRRGWALFLAGCGCPSFDEMVVDDHTDMAGFAFLDDIDRAIVDFATWTGRDGVCVPEVNVVQTIDGETAGGIYRGENWSILVDRDVSDPHHVTVHELCHALDQREGHTDPDLFPPVEADSNYPTLALREAEGFARECEAGPYDFGLTRFVEDACGSELVPPHLRYLQDEVWTAFPRTAAAEGPAPWTISDGTLGLEPWFTVYDAVAVEGRFWLLVDWYVQLEDLYALGVVEIDPATGALVGDRVRLPVENGRGTFANSDAGLVVLASDGDLLGARAFTVEDGAAVPLDLPLLPIYPDGAALSEGVLYVSGYDETWHYAFRAWSVETSAPVVVLTPAGGVEAVGGEGVVRLRDGAWERVLEVPDDVYGFGRLSDHERLFFVGSGTPIVHDETTGEWRLPPGACEARPTGPIADDAQGGALMVGGWYATAEETIAFTRFSPG